MSVPAGVRVRYPSVSIWLVIRDNYKVFINDQPKMITTSIVIMPQCQIHRFFSTTTWLDVGACRLRLRFTFTVFGRNRCAIQFFVCLLFSLHERGQHCLLLLYSNIFWSDINIEQFYQWSDIGMIFIFVLRNFDSIKLFSLAYTMLDHKCHGIR